AARRYWPTYLFRARLIRVSSSMAASSSSAASSARPVWPTSNRSASLRTASKDLFIGVLHPAGEVLRDQPSRMVARMNLCGPLPRLWKAERMALLVTDADIVTMAAGTAPARAMLIRDDRIAAAGPAEQVHAAAAPDARVVRLEGAAVVPGLIDAHCHLCNVGYLASGADCSQPAAPDIPAILARLRDAATRTPEGSWVTGSGYVEYKLREGRHPTRADLGAA